VTLDHLPDWVRVVAVMLIWVIFPLQLWTIHRFQRLYRQWQAGEEARLARWKRDMEAAAKLHEEASHLRAQAEVALAQARQQHLNGRYGVNDDD
jgi:hypothetical protein